MKQKPIKVCALGKCGKEFIREAIAQKYCSNECSAEARNISQLKWITKNENNKKEN
jgi:hypothetical protein